MLRDCEQRTCKACYATLNYYDPELGAQNWRHLDKLKPESECRELSQEGVPEKLCVAAHSNLPPTPRPPRSPCPATGRSIVAACQLQADLHIYARNVVTGGRAPLLEGGRRVRARGGHRLRHRRPVT